MACQSGCCGSGSVAGPTLPLSPPAPLPVCASADDESCPGEADSPGPLPRVPLPSSSLKAQSCVGSCCASEAESQGRNSAESLAACVSICGAAVCMETAAGHQEPCKPSTFRTPGDTHSPDTSPGNSDPTPGCCDGKQSPCCDESCLDRLALRECESLARGTGCQKRNSEKPCIVHLRKARSMYAGKLDSLGCICRALVALGQESCCALPSRSRRAVRNDHLARPPRLSGDSPCVGNNSDCCVTLKTGPGILLVTELSDENGAGHDSCCTSKSTAVPRTILPPNPRSGQAPSDVEKGGLSAHTEHVILSVSGMTCTGCEAKLARVLSALPAVTNLRTSLILSRAEFDLAAGSFCVADVIKHLERATEFTAGKITNIGSSIDIALCHGSAADVATKLWPHGVLEVRRLDKATVVVDFDAKIIGARDLLKHGCGSGPLTLAPLRVDSALEAGSRHVRSVGWMTLLSACLTIPVLVLAWAPLPKSPVAYGSASLGLATIVQTVVAGPFYMRALKSLVFSHVVEMDLLVVLSTTTAYVFSIVSFVFMAIGRPLPTGQFFETSTLLVTLVMLGRWVAAFARQKAVESISIRSLQNPRATIVLEDGRESDIDARLLQYGDVFKVAPDSKVPTDGTVIRGSSEVNESMITGESQPVAKSLKSSLVAGSINGDGTLHAKLTRLPGENTISTIAAMVDDAKLSKPRVQNFADQVASYFVPVIVCLTTVTFCAWIAVCITVRGQSSGGAAITAITYAIAVLIVSCPCAIGLAVPMVVVISCGIAADHGIIFKSAEAIELMHKTTHVVFDKTGTLTTGKMTVVREWYSGNSDIIKGLLLGLVGDITHPVSSSVAHHLRRQNCRPSSVINKRSLAGEGVEGTVKHSGQLLQAGNSRWLSLGGDTEVQSMLARGYTTFCFVIDGVVAAVVGLQDTLRPDAALAVECLIRRGVSIHIISGDERAAVSSVAAQLGIGLGNVRAVCSPSDKQAYIRGLLAPSPDKRHKTPVVVFCGDGTNDAAAIAQATIGVHVHEGGTDLAQSAADIVLMRPDLCGILTAINVSKLSVRRICFNFVWSFIYNLLAILLAGGAFVHAHIPPEFAGLGELVSVLPVVAVAVLMRWVTI